MYDQAWHSLSNEKKLVLPSSTWDTTGSSFTHTISRLRSSYVRSLIGTGTLYYAAVSIRSLGAGNLTTSWQLVFRTEISLSLERTPFKGQVVHDRSLAIERFPQTVSHAKHLTTAPLIHDSKLRFSLQPSLLRSTVNLETRIITLQELSKAVVVAYIERTIRGTNPRPTFDIWAHNLSSEATQGKASAVADKRLPNHWAKDFWLRV